MSRPLCDRAALTEAMFDGRLGPAEQASTERHMKSCGACADLVRDLNSLQGLLRASQRPISALEHQRARSALLRQTASASPTQRRTTALLVVALLALPLAAWAATASLPLLGFGDKAAHSHAAARQPPRARQLSQSAPPASSPTPVAVPAATPAASKAPASPAPDAPSPSSAQRPRRARHATPPKRGPAAAAAESSHASQDFAEGMNALSRGDFRSSARKLADFASNYPLDPRVEDATYLEAIALERAGRLFDAKAAAQRYLALYPKGAHHVQARRIAGD